MKLETVCQIAVVLTVFSVLALGAGNSVMYLQYFSLLFEPSFMIRVLLPMLSSVISCGSFVLFMIGLQKHLKSGTAAKELYIFSGVFTIIAMIIGTLSYTLQVQAIAENTGSNEVMLYIMHLAVSTVEGILFCIFVLMHTGFGTELKKTASTLLAVSLLSTLVYFASIALYFTGDKFQLSEDNFLYFAGYFIVLAGYVVYQFTGVFFLIGYLACRRADEAGAMNMNKRAECDGFYYG